MASASIISTTTEMVADALRGALEQAQKFCECRSRNKNLRIIGFCRATTEFEDDGFLADFLLLMSVFADQNNVVSQKWFHTFDVVAEIQRLGGIKHGRPDKTRIVIRPDYINKCVMEGKLVQVERLSLMDVTREEIENVSMVADSDTDVLIVAMCHGSGRPESKGELVWWFDEDGNQLTFTREALEESIAGTAARVTLISTGCYANAFSSPHYNHLADSTDGKGYHHYRSASDHFRGGSFIGRLHETLRDEFCPRRMGYLTANGLSRAVQNGMYDDAFLEDYPNYPRLPHPAPILNLEMSRQAKEAGHEGINVPPRPLEQFDLPGLSLKYSTADANPILHSPHPSESPESSPSDHGSETAFLVNYYMSSRPYYGDADKSAQTRISLHRKGKLPSKEVEKMKKFIIHYKAWNTEINMAIKKFMVTNLKKIEESDSALYLGAWFKFLDKFPQLRSLVPDNPVHPAWRTGIDEKQMFYISKFVERVGVSKVENWLRQTRAKISLNGLDGSVGVKKAEKAEKVVNVEAWHGGLCNF
ncbi:hypothetical protein BJ508DRAFT_349516 [Ascobolus immersus RN42]|uniref:Uncharacterized protein n=1 Tax=Ascobolus immersus RN42 TaxID=1160509 RepID=A0A3N4HWQ3_ASCIM|nr:hypothetical protein BJ508DRAFT_349516 [Ascobolus immersus RN42]